MYNLLIVDDEKVAVDTLCEVLQDIDHPDISIFKAYSGTDALNWLDRARIDIVITDVCMPDINGMELHEIILKRWPRCKVVFLSGYDNFEYIRTAMRNKGVDYIVKTDGDEAVFDAIKKAMEQILQEERNDKLLSDARKDFLQYLPVLQKEYVLEILRGGRYSPDEMQSRFEKLDMRFVARIPVLLLIGHVDDWEGNNHAEKKTDITYKIQNIVKEYLKDSFIIISAMDSSYEPIWLLQPEISAICDDGSLEDGEHVWSNAMVTLHNMLDPIQNSCRHFTGVRISFVFTSKPCEWDNVDRKFDELLLVLSNMPYGSGKEMILNDGMYENPMGVTVGERYDSVLISLRQKLKMAANIGSYLDNGQTTEFNAVFSDIIEFLCGCQAFPAGVEAEIYYSIALMFQSYINRLGIMHEIARSTDLDKLMHMEKHDSWQDIKVYFYRLAVSIFNLRDSKANERTNVIVSKIQKYISNNLDKDLSAITLADLVHLNQSYLSRLYKQTTGTSLSDYIIRVKVDKARELLGKGKLRINEIASLLGFSSHACFTRFFRRYAGVSPNEYKNA